MKPRTHPGWELFAQADWAAARDAFAGALEADPGDPEALDGLGQSLWWLGERDAAHRPPPRGLRRLPAPRRRARTPGGRGRTWPASTASTAARPRRRAGWRGRAACSRARPPCAELGWLAIEEAKRAERPRRRRAARARRARRRARARRPRHRVHGAGAARPRARRARAASTRASALLDEAMTVALGGETSDPLACGDACCTTLVVCDGLADLQRARSGARRSSSSPSGAASCPCSRGAAAIYGARARPRRRLGSGPRRC